MMTSFRLSSGEKSVEFSAVTYEGLRLILQAAALKMWDELHPDEEEGSAVEREGTAYAGQP